MLLGIFLNGFLTSIVGFAQSIVILHAMPAIPFLIEMIIDGVQHSPASDGIEFLPMLSLCSLNILVVHELFEDAANNVGNVVAIISERCTKMFTIATKLRTTLKGVILYALAPIGLGVLNIELDTSTTFMLMDKLDGAIPKVATTKAITCPAAILDVEFVTGLAIIVFSPAFLKDTQDSLIGCLAQIVTTKLV